MAQLLKGPLMTTDAAKKQEKKPSYYIKLKLSDKAAEQLTEKVEQLVEPDKIEREKARMEERERKREVKDAERDKRSSERQAAIDGETKLKAVLDELQILEDARNPQVRDEVRRRLDALNTDKRKHQTNIARLERELDAEQDSFKRVLKKREVVYDRWLELTDDHATGGLIAVRVKVTAAWTVSQAAWARLGTGYRKKNRDRKLKNRVKAVLGITLS